ncbi:MAG: YjfI family protein [Magnetococcus sp. DMHC-1]|nr:DUF2170 family protein [Magnetococcales bacterium]
MSGIETIFRQLQAASQKQPAGQGYHIDMLSGESGVARLILDDPAAMPIFLWVTGQELLCVTYLMQEDEVKPESRCQMLEAMLGMNIPMHLSSFGKFDRHFVLFGALSVDSSVEIILQDIHALGANALEALEAMATYLK